MPDPVRPVPEDDMLVAMGFYDDHPANCIASWQCPGTTGCGYPDFAVSPGVEAGCRNLAVFTAGCNFDCLFCQDWIHKTMAETAKPRFTDDEILDWIDDRTTCVCFCGGTPDVQLAAVTRIAVLVRERYADRVMRICAETNLTAPGDLLLPFAHLVHDSGGGFNIGLKAGTEPVHLALTGTGNTRVWRNIERLRAEFGPAERVELIRPSLLVVPGYIDVFEVRAVAARLAAIDADLTLKLIPFLPRYLFDDLPAAADELVATLAAAAADSGLHRVDPPPDDVGQGGRFVR